MGKREAEGETEGEAEESLIHRESTEHMHAHQAGSACKSYHNKRSAQALSSLAHTQSSAQYTRICVCVCASVHGGAPSARAGVHMHAGALVHSL